MADENPNDPPADEDENPTDPPEEDEDDGDEDDDPAAVKAERDKLRTLMTKLKGERTNLRKELKAAREGAAPKDGPPAKEAKEVTEARNALGKAEDRAKRQAAVLALTEAGLTKDQAKRSLRLLDLDSVELDADGDADLSEQIDDLKSDFPELFGNGKGKSQKAPRLPAGGQGGGRTPAQPKRDKTSEALLRQAGYIR